MDKTTPLDSDCQYGDPSSKYESTRRMYDPTHHGMRSTTEALTWRPSKPAGAMTPEPRIVATNSTSKTGDQRLGTATNFYMTPPEDQKAMTKATTETTSRRIADEPPPCLQCCHGRHSSTVPHLTVTWTQDHDDNHAQTCAIRQCSLQAKFTRPLP
jgi:hypothetical protein